MTARYLAGAWGSGAGFTAGVEITNTTQVPQDWVLVLVYPAGVNLTGECWWAITCAQSGRTVTIAATQPQGAGNRFIGFNAALSAPASATSPSSYAPVQCTINGDPCGGS